MIKLKSKSFFITKLSFVVPVVMVIALSLLPFPTRAAEYDTPEACRLLWDVSYSKPGSGASYGVTFTFSKDDPGQFTGKALSIAPSSDTAACDQYQVKYWSSGLNAQNKWTDLYSDDSCKQASTYGTYDVPISFSGFTDTYKAFRLNLSIYKGNCGPKIIKTLTVTGCLDKCTSAAGGTGGTTSGGTGGKTGGDPSTNPPKPGPCYSSDGSTKPVGADGKCPPGTVTTISTPPSVKQLYNPINSETLIGLALSIMKMLLAGVAALAMVFIVLGSFRLVVSRGNPEAVTRGKDILIWSIAGLAVALMAFSLVAIVQNLLGAYKQ